MVSYCQSSRAWYFSRTSQITSGQTIAAENFSSRIKKKKKKKTNKQKEFIKFKAKPFNVKACNKALEASSLDNEATSLHWVSVVERSGFFQFMSETECLWQRCEFRSLAGEIAELCGKCLRSLMLLMVEQTAFLALKPFWVYICFHQSLVNDMIIAHHLQMFLTWEFK